MNFHTAKHNIVRHASRTANIAQTLFYRGSGQFLLFAKKRSAVSGRLLAKKRSYRAALKPAICYLLSAICLLTILYTRAGTGTRAYAAANNTINFQARLMMGNGVVAPDGTSYAVEFKLYDAETGGTLKWTESRAGVSIKNGYLSESLGSVTPFPGTINWSDELWLTMNINGDGEMDPRLRLTGVPLAFRAKQADGITNGAGTLTANDLAQLAPASAQVINSALAALRLNQTGAGGLLELETNSVAVLGVANNGDISSAGDGAFAGGTLNLGAALQAGGLVLSDGSGNTGTIITSALGSNRTYTLPDADGTICLTTTCSTATNVLVNDGNSFGVAATIGTNDTQDVVFEAAGTERVRIDQSTGFVKIGSGAASERLQVDGAINIGNTSSSNAGTLRWTGTDFEGYDGTGWKSLTLSGSLSVNPVANKRKAVDETQNNTVNATATLQDDDELFFAIGANETWSFRFLVQGNANATPDFKFAVTAPGGATCRYGTDDPEGATSVANLACGVSTGIVAGNTAEDVYEIVGTVVNGATPGNITLQWAQNTANALNSIVRAGSFLEANRIAGPGQTAQAFIQTGNAFGAAATLGTTDNNSLNLITNGNNVLTLSAAGLASFTNGVSVGSGLTVVAGGATITGDSTISGVLSGLTGLASSGAITLSGLSAGLVQADGSGVLSSGVVDRNSATFFSGSLDVANGGTGAGIFAANGLVFGNGSSALQATAAGTSGQLLIADASGVPRFRTVTGDATISDTGAFTITSIPNNSVVLGTDTTGDYIQNLGTLTGLTASGNSGESSTPSLSVVYGSGANNAAAGANTFTCTSGTGNLTGGGTTVTIGISGTACAALDTAAAVSFGTSVTTPIVTSSGALSLSSTGANALTLTSGNGTIIFGASTLQNNSSSFTIDANNAGLSTVNISNNNGTDVANLSVEGAVTAGTGLTVTTGNLVLSAGAIQTGLTVRLTNGGALQNITGLTFTSGGIDLASGGVVNAGTIGGVAGLTFTSGDLALGGGNITGVGTISATGAITAATATNTINGLIINAGSLSGITTINMTGAITAATSTNTINGLVINAGALSGVTTISASGLAAFNGGITGSGLVNCDASNNRLTWNSTTSNFGCATLDAKSYIDTTSDAVADNNTTNYWDPAAENGSVYPNITPSAATSEVFGIVTMETTSSSNNDVEVTSRIERTINGTNPVCGSSTTVGAQPGTFSSTTGAQKASSVNFMDAAATTNQVRYTLCADTATSGTAATITRIRFTLFELNNSADLAEVYPTNDLTLRPGELVALDNSLTNGVVRSNKAYQGDLYGVISTEPAMVIGGTGGLGKNGVAVALSGRVPVKVSAQNGAIKKGDALTSSSVPGVAMKATKAGTIIGLAMEDYEGQGQGQVMVFVKSGYYNGSNLNQIFAEQVVKDDYITASRGVLNEFMQQKQTQTETATDLSDIFTDRLAAAFEIVTPEITTDKIALNTIEAATGADIGVKLQDDGRFIIKNKDGEEVVSFDAEGNANFKGTINAAHQTSTLNISNGLNLVGGGASVVGGLDNNSGGITEAGAISGATTIAAESLKLTANTTDSLLELKKDEKGVFTVFNNGALQIQLDSAQVFAVKDAAGTGIFNIDSQSGKVNVGSANDTKTVLFVLDNRSLPDDPPGAPGASYFNTKLERFRCYDGKWRDCMPAGDATDPFNLSRVAWNMPLADNEFADSPRIISDLYRAHEYRLRIRVLNGAAAGAACRVQYAGTDNGPWQDVADGSAGELPIDQPGTLKTDWLKLKEDARKEDTILRVMCRGGNGQTVVFNGVSMQLR